MRAIFPMLLAYPLVVFAHNVKLEDLSLSKDYSPEPPNPETALSIISSSEYPLYNAGLGAKTYTRAKAFCKAQRKAPVDSEIKFFAQDSDLVISFLNDQYSRGSQDIETERTRWEPAGFTNPIEHTESKYRHIVHSLSGQLRREVQQTACLERAIAIISSNPSEFKAPAAIIDLMKEPYRISEKPIISASLISDEKTGTFASFGFILKVPTENIYASLPGDMGSINVFNPNMTEKEKLNELTLLQASYGLHTPDELLSQTESDNYNEIAIVGTSPSGKKVEISGIFYKTDNKGIPKASSEEMATLKRLSIWLTVPLISIKSASNTETYSDQPIKVITHHIGNSEFYSVSMNQDGFRYILHLEKGKEPEYCAYKNHNELLKSDEITSFFKRAIAEEATKNSELQQFLKKFEVE